ncbi:DICT sensory domain-containing protein [Amycolatopsis sp. H20-H5]|uniref:DICT sensory domain-containing protein n=1 Tax=Amycolatopsis sp. H20-H5 TaxID=3046309 RepID=UPI002DBD9973|nr:DICT sensory domain-containing protein [Amycolatopsis sp. H20-H5]MEC3981490.1 DICT sensory domain-containing protein [Amycolatopsis sp. H20-H5]
MVAEKGASARAGLLTKRALVIASHAVEHAALSDVGLEQAVVIAMFQRLPYFEREREVYARIAQRAKATVVGMVDRSRPDLPPGVTPVLLSADEQLASEWSVAVLSPTFGASVVAQDLAEVEDQVTSLEAARLFDGRWGFRRDESYAEIVRLRDALGDRLPPPVRAAIDSTLRSVVLPAATEVEVRTEAALRHLAGRLVEQRSGYATLRQEVAQEKGYGRDPWTGLHTLGSLPGWLGISAPGTLALGLTLLRVTELPWLAARLGSQVSMHTEINIADALHAEIRTCDQAVRVSKDEFLLVQPAVSGAEANNTARTVLDRLEELGETYPFVRLSGTAAVTVSADRPLPLNRLRSQLREREPELAGSLSGTLAGPNEWFR